MHISGMMKLQNIIINDGELIRWIDSNGKCHDNEKDNEEFVKRGEKYWNNSLKALKGEGTKTDNGNVSD